MQLQFSEDGDGAVTALWRTCTEWEGFRGIIHGGIISTVLDEAMSKAVAAMGWQALTCELRVRFRRQVSAAESLQVRGWIVEKRKRQILTRATLRDQNGAVRAEGWAVFLVLTQAPTRAS
jgi:acyl-coenzyme A thioesterase PaaI-like protein